MPKFHKLVYHKIIRPSRLNSEAGIINRLKVKTLLEVGYFDDSLKRRLRKDIEYNGIDPSPTKYIPKTHVSSVEDFKIDKKFDVVVASNILEHTYDPVKAMKKIKTLSKKYVFISLPYEPFYTITRFFAPEEEHYWTIHPNILEYYFGKPVYEKYLHLRRTYVAVYRVS